MPFVKGQPRPPNAGRKKGSKDKLTAEARVLAQSLLSKTYRNNLQKRMDAGTAGPIEGKVWEYAFGKPADRVDISGVVEFRWGGMRRGDVHD